MNQGSTDHQLPSADRKISPGPVRFLFLAGPVRSIL